MGIRDKVQSKVAKAFNSKLSDAVLPFTGSYVTEGDYDPVTEQSNQVTHTYTGRGVLGKYDIKRIDGVNILSGDIKLTALQNEVSEPPKVDHIITTTDLVTHTSQSYKVINVGSDPAEATYSVQLRRA
ncbi:glutamate 5-kinase [Rosenbergiella australiborealis]|uniref:glutamate 5-kinase n=1 Tax=Rosenbergiella australiborealis TaxID=1544696 RepID=UPI001F4D8AA4|nr:glutamate 5-kinase [Rosenbergiella australiborealis]